jgi:hypothetical protein
MHYSAGLGDIGVIMILTINEILDPFEDDIPELLRRSLGTLPPKEEIIRKELQARMLRFEEGETAIIGVISDLRKDRDNEVILPEGMDDSNYSGVVLWQHDYWREDIPHARSMWRQVDPKGSPYQVIAKTQYLGDISDLGFNVYEYRKAEHPLGQSIGFRSTESVSEGDTGYDDIYKDWKVRVKAMLKEKGIRATPHEFSEPSRFFTKWELWEYSDVFIGSNPDALQIAVSKGIISNEQAKTLVEFKNMAEPDGGRGEIDALLERIAALEKEIEELKQPPPAPLSLEEMWNGAGVEKTLQGMWDQAT